MFRKQKDNSKPVYEALGHIIDPASRQDIISAGMVTSVQMDKAGHAVVVITVDAAQGSALESLRQDAEKTVSALKEVKKATVILTAETKSAPPPKGPDPHGMNKNPPLNIPARHIIAVASGKGGVGKSTVTANLAAYIANKTSKDYSVGLLDADIYGPSQPVMMGKADYKPELDESKKIQPPMRHNIKMMSIGYMTDPDKALIWRGPMAQSAFYQMLRDVAWSDNVEGKEVPLDFLFIDLPPGTGDIQLTLAQKVKLTGAIIVSTPQDIALIDARRAVQMFEKTNVPILGIIENMSTHICSNCGHEEHIFGHGGAKDEAKKLGVPYLGGIALSKSIRTHSDEGTPVVLSDPESAEGQSFAEVAEGIFRQLLVIA
ncbi:MAG: Mrp/NBP35 family ATP-binding protein [Alphaproteobacteria bacterium]|nr:Mrp/NBP35 family ATP-binding protein [Alphaproteobacteria bacterium]